MTEATDNGMEEARQKRVSDLMARYDRAMHAVQSGILAELRLDPNLKGTPEVIIQRLKDLRTGIDGSKSDMAGLVTLLIEKGIFTDEKYIEAMALAAEREQALHEKRLSAKTGKDIKLG